MPLSMSMTSHIFRNVLQQVLKNTFVEGVLSTGRYVNAIRGSTGCALEPKRSLWVYVRLKGRGKDSREILTQAFGLDDCLST